MDGVLETVDKYWAEYLSNNTYGTVSPWNHTTPTSIKINPYYLEMRLNGEKTFSCGQPSCPKSVNYVVIHEARHCYQEFLSSIPNNDDDQDWLVKIVSIDPTIYLLDTNTSRTTCDGNKSFSGDATADSYVGNVQEAIEKDAYEYATAND